MQQVSTHGDGALVEGSGGSSGGVEVHGYGGDGGAGSGADGGAEVSFG